jgi:hypothetical protein
LKRKLSLELVAIFLLFIILKAREKVTTFLKQSVAWAHRRLWLPIGHNVALHFRIWRYALLRDFVTAIVIVILLIFGTISALVTVYTSQQAFGTPVNYIVLAITAAAASVVASVGGYLTNRFRGSDDKTPEGR